MSQAAEKLGVCEAALKRICRRNHVHKWPYRQLTSVRRRIAGVKERRRLCQQGSSQADVSLFDDKLRELEQQQEAIVQSVHQRPSCQAQGPRSFEPLTLLLQDRDPSGRHPPMDMERVQRDFPLLFLANVCASVNIHLP